MDDVQGCSFKEGIEENTKITRTYSDQGGELGRGLEGWTKGLLDLSGRISVNLARTSTIAIYRINGLPVGTGGRERRK